MGIPGMGVGKGGLGHQQMTWLEFGVSSPLATVTPEIVIGKIHFQQMSEMGFTNRPTQFADVSEGNQSELIRRKAKNLISFIFSSPPTQPL